MLTGYEFDLSGGRAALDFANTLSRTSGEHLPDFAALVDFAAQAGLVDEPTAARLLADGRRQPEVAAAVHARAVALRGAIFGICAARAGAEPAPPAALETLNREVGRALAHALV